MEIVLQIFLSALQVIVGLILGLVFADPQRIPSWLRLLSRDSWEGQWFYSMTDPDDPSAWITDKVSLTRSFGKLKVETNRPQSRYDWDAVLSLKPPYLVGQYRSKKPNALSFGPMQLKVLPQGNIFLGYCSGPADTGKLVSVQFILAEKEEDLERGRERFNELR